jgi:hypothetical protein
MCVCVMCHVCSWCGRQPLPRSRLPPRAVVVVMVVAGEEEEEEEGQCQVSSRGSSMGRRCGSDCPSAASTRTPASLAAAATCPQRRWREPGSRARTPSRKVWRYVCLPHCLPACLSACLSVCSLAGVVSELSGCPLSCRACMALANVLCCVVMLWCVAHPCVVLWYDVWRHALHVGGSGRL